MRVRLKKRYQWRRQLTAGCSTQTFGAGDYIVGADIPEEAAHGAINAGVAIKLPEKGQRETKSKTRTKREQSLA